MAAETLPIFPIHTLKDSIPYERYDAITGNVAQKLGSAIKLSNDLQAQTWTNFLSSYLGDVARQRLAQISTGHGSSYIDQLSESERNIRKCTLHLVRLLASQQADFPGSMLVDLAVAYYPLNTTTLRLIFDRALSVAPRALEFTSTVVTALVSALAPKHPDVIELREVAHTLKCLTSCGNEAVRLVVEDGSFIKALVECYQSVLPKLADSLGGIHLTGDQASYEATWIETKVDLLESYHAIIRALAGSPKNPERALEIISQVFDISGQPNPAAVPFLDSGLNDDLNRIAELKVLLSSTVPADDPRLEVIAAQLAPTATESDIGALAILPVSAQPKVSTTRVNKGKGKETSQPEEAPDPALDSLVSQVLDIFPDQDPAIVRSALQDSRFNRSSEAVINALLEGEKLPEPISTPVPAPAPARKNIIPERRNVFDDDEMDYSKLRIGKKRENADAVLNDKSFLAAQKADILRRAAEVSDVESEWQSDEDRKPMAVAFFEEDDEYGGGPGVVNDGEASSESDSELDESPDTVIELAWLENPKVFERDAETRRSKARADLRAQTTWSDEQIEGWKSMLDRDPRRQAKIHEKHEFKGNQPTLPPSVQYDAPRGGRGRGGDRGRGRGRGGRGRGGNNAGGGEGSSGDASHDRANKDKNKAHRANHDRKRGHDKKMARGGFNG